MHSAKNLYEMEGVFHREIFQQELCVISENCVLKSCMTHTPYTPQPQRHIAPQTAFSFYYYQANKKACSYLSQERQMICLRQIKESLVALQEGLVSQCITKSSTHNKRNLETIYKSQNQVYLREPVEGYYVGI